MVVLGKVVGAWGVKGALKIFQYGDDPAGWAKLDAWWLGVEGSDTSTWKQYKVLKCRPQVGVSVAELEGIADKDVADGLRGFLVGVPRESLPPAKDGEYYWGDLIGLEVFNQSDALLGTVAGLIDTPGNQVLRVVEDIAGRDKRKERLLPFVKQVVLDVDFSCRRITVDWGVDW